MSGREGGRPPGLMSRQGRRYPIMWPIPWCIWCYLPPPLPVDRQIYAVKTLPKEKFNTYFDKSYVVIGYDVNYGTSIAPGQLSSQLQWIHFSDCTSSKFSPFVYRQYSKYLANTRTNMPMLHVTLQRRNFWSLLNNEILPGFLFLSKNRAKFLFCHITKYLK